jgi:hypothetical protein
MLVPIIVQNTAIPDIFSRKCFFFKKTKSILFLLFHYLFQTNSVLIYIQIVVRLMKCREIGKKLSVVSPPGS